MNHIRLALLLSSVIFSLASKSPAYAQTAYQASGATGVYGRTTRKTNNFRRGNSRRTQNQRIGYLPRAGFGGVSQVHGPRGRNGLPPTRFDSFVREAGDHAAHIYGDEGAVLPPYDEFSKPHRINTGILSDKDVGLTTGHGSVLPDAWGGDEFVDGPEFTRSGANNGNPQHYSQGNYLGNNPGNPQYADIDASPTSSLPPLESVVNRSRLSNFGNSFSNPAVGLRSLMPERSNSQIPGVSRVMQNIPSPVFGFTLN